jgi:hypothetical protein
LWHSGAHWRSGALWHSGDLSQALISIEISGDDLRTSHASRAAFLSKPAALRPDRARRHRRRHLGQHFDDAHSELATAAVKLIFYSADSQVIEWTWKSALETRLGTTFPVIS